ncbi:hypothetical protein DUK53_14635 [Listeria sp. SHR_NRA_18]|uniref:hypothetical protein n=1 Tax=Listeria TaxID=1637 RepID=UPI00051DA924|nr:MULTISPECIES: hypothetical protein [Listeria]KGL43741.1 hypothetical protein EP56_08030 [Listeriaceae bacterium FSL A5-0209]KMT61757.1 accessory regulator protein C [Listeria newyorkensis]RQW65847.1 hypothetical protein DUK53_14635 [Listeria sp. SHR_NRA_18]
MQSVFLLTVSGVSQLFILVMSANIIGRRFLTRREVVYLGIILSLIGTPLLVTVQYFSLLVVLGITILAFRWKKKSWIESVVLSILPLFLMICINYVLEWITVAILGGSNAIYEGNIVSVIISSIILYLMAYAVSLLIEKLSRAETYRNNSKESSYLMVALLIVTIIMMYLFIYLESLYSFSNDIIIANSLLFCIYAIGINCVFMLILRAGQLQLQIKKQKVQLGKLNEYTREMERISSDMNNFNHDYINILTSLHGYIEKGDTLLLKNYFQETIQPLNQALLNSKTQLSEFTNRKDLSQ